MRQITCSYNYDRIYGVALFPENHIFFPFDMEHMEIYPNCMIQNSEMSMT